MLFPAIIMQYLYDLVQYVLRVWVFFKSKNKEDTADILGEIHIKNNRFSNYGLKEHKYANLINFECKFKATKFYDE